VTEDHLPPQGIYPSHLRKGVELHWVPACASCNGGGSIEDEEFKVFIGFQAGGFDDSAGLFVNHVAGTAGHNARILRQIVQSKKAGYARVDGDVLRPVVQVSFDGVKYDKVISRIVRGLYWRKRGVALGLKADVNVFPQKVEPSALRLLQEIMNSLQTNRLNNAMFSYKVAFMEDGSSLWGMEFFGKHQVFAFAEPNPQTFAS
jgi:hypothetical protein